MVKIGVAGLGFMGATHLDAWSKVAGAEIAAVASDDPKKLAGDLSGTGGNLDRGGQTMDFGDAARYSLADDMFAAIDLVESKVRKQIRRLNSRLKDHRDRSRIAHEGEAGAPGAGPEDEETYERVVREMLEEED